MGLLPRQGERRKPLFSWEENQYPIAEVTMTISVVRLPEPWLTNLRIEIQHLAPHPARHPRALSEALWRRRGDVPSWNEIPDVSGERDLEDRPPLRIASASSGASQASSASAKPPASYCCKGFADSFAPGDKATVEKAEGLSGVGQGPRLGAEGQHTNPSRIDLYLPTSSEAEYSREYVAPGTPLCKCRRIVVLVYHQLLDIDRNISPICRVGQRHIARGFAKKCIVSLRTGDPSNEAGGSAERGTFDNLFHFLRE